MIVGTAGHIDHGKTALIKALTGVDTDRLKEEKARGISIELGYAFAPLASGDLLGFVDVPGHEKFIDHMVAGATGIDFVLLVVAADDGVMPQTVEHLEIARLLDVGAGAVVITKIDRADTGRTAEVAQEIHNLLAATPLAEAPMFAVSNVTGEGISALRAHLEAQAMLKGQRRARRGVGFRLAVDRVFSLSGVGTVVTGTVFAGQIAVGEEIVVTPTGIVARVGSIHTQNRPAQHGRAGERCALALAGVAKEAITRGDWVVSPSLHAPTSRFDVRLQLSQREEKSLQYWTAVHLHLGAAHVMARVALLDAEQLPPGGECLAQLLTERPIGALADDAFIVRDTTASRTLGGGRVLDPFAPQRKRKTAERLALLDCMRELDPDKRVAALVERSTMGLDLTRTARAMNMPSSQLVLPQSAVRVRSPQVDRAFAAIHWDKLSEHLVDRLSRFHAEHPDAQGVDVGRIGRMWLTQFAAPVVTALAEGLRDAGRLARTGPWWHLPTHSVTLSAREEVLAQRILPMLEQGGVEPPWVRDLARTLGTAEQEVRTLMLRLARSGQAFQVVKDLFYTPRVVARLARIAKEISDEHGAVRAAPFRDRIGVGRKRAIQILEFFDRVAFTHRARDDHHIRGDHLLRLEERG